MSFMSFICLMQGCVSLPDSVITQLSHYSLEKPSAYYGFTGDTQVLRR